MTLPVLMSYVGICPSLHGFELRAGRWIGFVDLELFDEDEGSEDHSATRSLTPSGRPMSSALSSTSAIAREHRCRVLAEGSMRVAERSGGSIGSPRVDGGQRRWSELGVDVSAVVVDEFEGGSVGHGSAGEVVWEAEVDPAQLFEAVELVG
jgi:hypothetical protein